MPENTLSSVDALIVGAGFAGLHQLYRFRELGLSARVIEAGDDVGGAWYWNRYPGLRCDTVSVSYSYSFSDELDQHWTWSEKYATQPEILRYIQHVADRFDLRRDITFGRRVVAAAFDESRNRWAVTLDDGTEIDTQYLVMASGNLTVKKGVDLNGLERFQGRILHTGDWPLEEVDFTGLRVGLVGTGSSGIQVSPIIAEQAAQLTIFQRTAGFSMPAANRPLQEDEVAEIKASYPERRSLEKYSPVGIAMDSATKGTFEVSDDERQARYEEGWATGDMAILLASYTDTIVDDAANATVADFVRRKITEIVNDPETADSLLPRGFAFGSKRVALDTGYYDMYNRDTVRLVDVKKTPLTSITEKGAELVGGEELEFDVLVLATGYDAMTGALDAIRFEGVDGALLKEKWAQGPITYLGVAMAGFPNLFVVTGPLSPSVLTSMVGTIEQHVDFITDLVRFARESGVDPIVADPAAEGEWLRHSEETVLATVYPGAPSWYMGANVEGKPQVFMPYIGGVGRFRRICEVVADAGFAGFNTSDRTLAKHDFDAVEAPFSRRPAYSDRVLA